MAKPNPNAATYETSVDRALRGVRFSYLGSHPLAGERADSGELCSMGGGARRADTVTQTLTRLAIVRTTTMSGSKMRNLALRSTSPSTRPKTTSRREHGRIPRTAVRRKGRPGGFIQVAGERSGEETPGLPRGLLHASIGRTLLPSDTKDAMLHSLDLLYFSPTGTTRTVVHAIADGLGVASPTTLDVSPPAARVSPPGLTGDLLLVAAPVYFGRVQANAAAHFRRMRAPGQGLPAVAVVVYGNRAWEDALVELCDIVADAGYSVVAGAAFVGEHSFSDQEHPLATGRPDARDVAVARVFGRAVRDKLDAGASALVPVMCDQCIVRVNNKHGATALYACSTAGEVTRVSYFRWAYVKRPATPMLHSRPIHQSLPTAAATPKPVAKLSTLLSVAYTNAYPGTSRKNKPFFGSG